MQTQVDDSLQHSENSELAVCAPNPAWKRATDLVCCVPALPVLALATLGMTVMMKLVSPGPVFFTQERVGYRGRRFMLMKFRTMQVNNDQDQHRDYVKNLVGTNAPMAKLDAKNDRRLIPGGWILRATGLDELPQLINVLRGEMSLVGPRPCIPFEYEMYQPWQLKRFDTLPGLTGLWQVSGKNRTTFDEMIRLDIRYAATKTWLMDIVIMLKTPAAILGQVSDTKLGRQSAAPISNYSIPPFSADSVDDSPKADAMGK